MKSAAILLAVSSWLAVPALTGAQSVVLVVDAGSARLDVEALRARVSAESGRALARLGDEGASPAAEALTIAFAGAGRWVLWHRRGAEDRWLERRASADATADVLARAATELLRPADADAAFGTRAGHDLVDPFARRWDPLRVALEGELVRPFVARGGMVYYGVSDPFAADATAVHLLDPWTP
ncbi:MAG: hypothetical protein KF729_09150 [Sandaracinaceae bacterium]|nr:hypothetical protein [Sandaracinaceae bacterium]